MSLDTVLQETAQRFHADQEKAAKEELEVRQFCQRLIVLRAPDAKFAHTRDLQTLLPEASITHMEALRRSYPDLDRLVLAPNLSSYSALGGHVLVLGPDQRIARMTHVVNVKSPFAVTMAVLVRNATYTSARDMRERYNARIVEYVRTLSRTGPALETHAPLPGSSEDAARWPVFFPAKRAHVGLYAAPSGQLYLITRNHAGAEVLSGASAVVDQASATAQSFVEDPRVKWMQGVAYRNAARLLHGLARFLGLVVPETQDHQSHSGERRQVRYCMVRPDVVHCHDTQRMTDKWGAPRALFFRDVIDGSQGAGEAALLQSDITKGYALTDAQAYAGDAYPALYPLTTDKIPTKDRPALTIDQRDHYSEKISFMMPRGELLTHHKYVDAAIGTPLSPVAVVRS